MDAEDYALLAENIRARGKVVRMRNFRGQAHDELKEIADSVPALNDEQISLLIYTLAVVPE